MKSKRKDKVKRWKEGVIDCDGKEYVVKKEEFYSWQTKIYLKARVG